MINITLLTEKTTLLINTTQFDVGPIIEPDIAESSQFKINIYISYLVISVIGILGNSVTIFLMMKSRTLRKSSVNILLINQSIIDLVVCVFSLVWISTDFYVKSESVPGTRRWFYCVFVSSQFFIAYTTCVSSYNLGLISMERCFSILAPVHHRTYCTKPSLYALGGLVWVFTLLLIFAYSLPVNGVTADGGCYFWSNFPSMAAAQAYSVLLLFGYNVVPILMMLVSYSLIYRSISGKKHVKDAIKLNVVKMLATCVLAYIVCHSFRSMVDVFSRFYHYSLRSYIFVVG